MHSIRYAERITEGNFETLLSSDSVLGENKLSIYIDIHFEQTHAAHTVPDRIVRDCTS